MAEKIAFKDVFNLELVENLATKIKNQYSDFKERDFINDCRSKLLELEMKGRVEWISQCLEKYLPNSYKESLKILLSILPPELPDEKGTFGMKPEVWMIWPLSIYVQNNGLDYFDISINAMKEMTQRMSCEFAIRYFILKYPTEMEKVLKSWINHKSAHVRRLISEGTRPYLPWGIKLDFIAKNPEYTLQFLEQLRDDESEYVRTSVANNLNDLTRENADLVVDRLKKWKKSDWKNADWIIKKGLRNLIKQNHSGALELVGISKANITVEDVSIKHKSIKIGKKNEFSFTIKNNSKNTQKLLIDYTVFYTKKNGKQSPKVFKLKTLQLTDKPITITQKQHFADKTTRVHYPGKHTIKIQINGFIYNIGDFDLIYK